MSHEKVLANPPATFRFDPARHLRRYQGPLWRVFPTTGDHPYTWDELRHWGPLPDQRFDPQPPPTGHHPDSGVMYTATRSWTAIAEVYQEEHHIDRSSRGAAIASWTPSRPLQLLDLTTNWPVLNGAAAAMMMDDKKHTQAWARAIDDQLGDRIDGLWHQSSINNEPNVTLFSRAERIPAFPLRPAFYALLSEAAADVIVKRAKNELGYTVA